MRISLTLSFLLVASLTCFSQKDGIDLNKYKFPDYKRHDLELSLSSFGGEENGTKDSYTNPGVMAKEDYLYTHNTSNFNLNYKYDYLTRKRIYKLTSSIKGKYYRYTSKSGDFKSEQTNPQIQFSLNGFRRYYLIENKFFLEANTELDYSYNRSKQTSTYENLYQYNKDNNQHGSVGLGVGSGRIEKVSDLWQASYILKKLDKQNSLNRQLEEMDVFEFATLASRLKNKRFLDSRTRRISELKGLDSLLHKQGLIKESDISYFTTLNDFWSYGRFPARESGRVFKLWFSPDYAYSSIKYTDKLSDVAKQKISLLSNVSYQSEKQLNSMWERTFNASATYETLIDTSGNWYSYPDNQIITNVNFGYGFYPNSRTDLHTGIGYKGAKIVIPTSPNSKKDEWANEVDVSLSGNYYFSSHLQIIFEYNISYLSKGPDYFDLIKNNYSLGLRYAIF